MKSITTLLNCICSLLFIGGLISLSVFLLFVGKIFLAIADAGFVTEMPRTAPKFVSRSALIKDIVASNPSGNLRLAPVAFHEILIALN